jgi:hypothetical protein
LFQFILLHSQALGKVSFLCKVFVRAANFDEHALNSFLHSLTICDKVASGNKGKREVKRKKKEEREGETKRGMGTERERGLFGCSG